MGHGQSADFLAQVLVEGPAAAHGLALEAAGAGRNKLQAEAVGEEAADFAVRDVELITEVKGGGFGGRADGGAGQFPESGGVHLPIAGEAMDLLVDKAGHDHARLQENILLEVLMETGTGGQVGALTERADLRGGHRHDLIHLGGLGAEPGRMPFGGAPLLGRSRGSRSGGRWGRRAAGLELAAMERLKLGAELLVFPFQGPLAAAVLI